MKSHLQFGSKKIDFKISFSNRKSLGISVTPDMKVFIKAPLSATIDKIKEKVYLKVPWIMKQQSFFLSFHPKTPAKQFIAGETHFYLGRQYRLKFIVSSTEAVKLKGKCIEVSSYEKSRIEQLVQNWYLQHARSMFTVIAQPLIDKFKYYKVEPSAIVLRQMPTRWGSCTPKGKIILNPELIKAPKGCIEYVIIHELCHLVHRDHTQKFIDLQAKEMPNWENWKNKLEKLMA